MTKTKNPPNFFDSTEVTSVVGIPSIYLNKFIERRKYGIAPSVRAGKGRGSRRLFSEKDVLGIALVWWLFESGLRSEMIQAVLDQSVWGDKRHVAASDAAWILRERKVHDLAIRREPRLGDKQSKRQMTQKVMLMDLMEEGPSWLLENLRAGILLFIPVHNLFEKLSKSMNELGQKRS